jgi:hypothetical protein
LPPLRGVWGVYLPDGAGYNSNADGNQKEGCIQQAQTSEPWTNRAVLGIVALNGISQRPPSLISPKAEAGVRLGRHQTTGMRPLTSIGATPLRLRGATPLNLTRVRPLTST